MERNIRRAAGVVLLLCAIFLSGCGKEKAPFATGLVTELQVDSTGALTGFVVQTGEEEKIGVLLTGETFAFPAEEESMTNEGLRADFQAELRPDVEVNVRCTGGKKAMTTDSGAQIDAWEASYVTITGWLHRGAVTVSDGTAVDVIKGNMGCSRTYRLANGTVLLRASGPSGPENSYVAGVESLDSLNDAAREKVLAYYEQLGQLYDELAELEKAYVMYRRLGEEFHSGVAEQGVCPTASGDRVIYFLTTVTLSDGNENGNVVNEIYLSDAFDIETGEYISTWDLFAAPKDEVIRTILDKSVTDEQPLRAELEAVPWEGRISFFPDDMSVWFEPGTLPSQTQSMGLGVDYDDDIKALFHDWAMPKSSA